MAESMVQLMAQPIRSFPDFSILCMLFRDISLLLKNTDYFHVFICLLVSYLKTTHGDKNIGYLKGNLNFQFQQIRQCLGMTLSGTLKMTRMNGIITISSTAFLRV
uniref:Uncharacterized protein n=1 Tax=Castor canadensis TaxID=51338 RepID=A0A8C0W876_CASCN